MRQPPAPAGTIVNVLPRAGLALDRDPARVGVHDVLHHGEADAGALDAVLAWPPPRARTSRKIVFCSRRGDAEALGRARGSRHSPSALDVHAAPCGSSPRVLHGVVQQVPERLGQRLAVGFTTRRRPDRPRTRSRSPRPCHFLPELVAPRLDELGQRRAARAGTGGAPASIRPKSSSDSTSRYSRRVARACAS